MCIHHREHAQGKEDDLTEGENLYAPGKLHIFQRKYNTPYKNSQNQRWLNSRGKDGRLILTVRLIYTSSRNHQRATSSDYHKMSRDFR